MGFGNMSRTKPVRLNSNVSFVGSRAVRLDDDSDNPTGEVSPVGTFDVVSAVRRVQLSIA